MKNYRSFIGEYNEHNWNVMFNVLKVAGPNFLGDFWFLIEDGANSLENSQIL